MRSRESSNNVLPSNKLLYAECILEKTAKQVLMWRERRKLEGAQVQQANARVAPCKLLLAAVSKCRFTTSTYLQPLLLQFCTARTAMQQPILRNKPFAYRREKVRMAQRVGARQAPVLGQQLQPKLLRVHVVWHVRQHEQTGRKPGRVHSVSRKWPGGRVRSGNLKSATWGDVASVGFEGATGKAEQLG